MLSSHCDYVADEREVGPGTYDVTDFDTAASLVDGYLTHRVYAVLDRWPGTPTLMLSGGIDSVLLATYVATAAPDAVAVTFVQPGNPDADREIAVAAAVANRLGLDHVAVSYVGGHLDRLLRGTAVALDSSEPWEVLAGAVLKAVDGVIEGDDGAIFSGAGADGLFMGGQTVDFRDEPTAAWDGAMRANIAKNFTRHRFIPDFYERLIENHERHALVWQTHEAVDLAQRLHPHLIRGTNLEGDKALFRRMAHGRGLPLELVTATKNPMQVSSGGIDAVVGAARAALDEDYGARTYTNPKDEPLAFTVARLYLQRLVRD